MLRSSLLPAVLIGSFTIATTSEINQSLAAQLLNKLSVLAPQLRITLINLSSDYSIRELESGKVDLVISVNWHAPEQLMQKRLFSDTFVCLMDQLNPLATSELTLQNYAQAMHIMVAPLGKDRGYIDEYLSEKNLQRQVRLSVPDFAQLQPLLSNTGHIVTLPSQVAQTMLNRDGLIIKELPFRAPKFDYYLFWHRRYTNENRNRWVRELIYELLKK